MRGTRTRDGRRQGGAWDPQGCLWRARGQAEEQSEEEDNGHSREEESGGEGGDRARRR